jgi:PAS domain S-box-containing protein
VGANGIDGVFRTLFAAYPDALVVADAGGRIVLANPSAGRLLGYSVEEFTGMGIDELVPDTIRPRHAEYRQAFAREPRARPMGKQTDLVARRKDGTEVVVEIALSPLHDHGHSLVVAAIRDIGAYPRMKQALLYTRLRHVALALGDRLVEQGVVAARDDVFYLSIDETIALADGNRQGLDGLRDAIAERRAEHLACEAMSPPDVLSLAPGEAWAPGTDAPQAIDRERRASLKGSGACGGTAVGPAAVVVDVTQADSLAAGTILVTRQTDPGWAAVFFLVKGLVVERGGMLSHGAIIAREYGIPAVVGVPDATQLIRDGDVLRVDGDAGVVEWRRA